MNDPLLQRTVSEPAVSRNERKRASGMALRWAGVAGVCLLQTVLWLSILPSFYAGASSGGGASGSSGSSNDDVADIVVGVCVCLIVAIAPPAGAAALAPRKPFLIGALVAFVPPLIALAKHPDPITSEITQGLLILTGFSALFGLLFGAFPVTLIRRRLALLEKRRQADAALARTTLNRTSQPASSSVWPPPPSSFE